MRKLKEAEYIKIVILGLFLGFTSVKSSHVYGQITIGKIHNEAIVVDAHAHGLSFNNDAKQLNIKMLKRGDVDVVGLYFAYYPLQDLTLLCRVKSDIKELQNEIESSDYNLILVENSQQIETAVGNGNLAIMLGVEYFYGIFQNKVCTIDSLYEIGIRAVTLMDNEYDLLSSENLEKESSAVLSDFGKLIIDRMNKLGMVIDISHLNDDMQKAVIDYSARPVIASHSPVRGVHDVARNIPDEILLKLKEKNGAIMITFNSGILAGLENGRTDINRLIDHIMHAIEVMGSEHVGIGSDYNGSGQRSPNGLENASGFPNITSHLLERGLSRTDTEKVLGLNYLNLLKRVEAYSNEMSMIFINEENHD